MSVREIMRCAAIISAVPHAEKAWAVAAFLASPLTNRIPATMLKTHSDYTLFADAASFADVREIVPLNGEIAVEDLRG